MSKGKKYVKINLYQTGSSSRQSKMDCFNQVISNSYNERTIQGFEKRANYAKNLIEEIIFASLDSLLFLSVLFILCSLFFYKM